MTNEGELDCVDYRWNRLQIAGAIVFVCALFVPSCISDHHVDEVSGPLPGIFCAFAALESMFSFKSHLSSAFAGWANPLALLYLWICRKPQPKSTRLQSYVAIAVLLWVGASWIALAQADFHPLFGYYLWIISILLLLSPEGQRFKRYVFRRN
jgi:hypothetical protein